MISTIFLGAVRHMAAFAARSRVATAAPAADYPTRRVESDRESSKKVLAKLVIQQ